MSSCLTNKSFSSSSEENIVIVDCCLLFLLNAVGIYVQKLIVILGGLTMEG